MRYDRFRSRLGMVGLISILVFGALFGCDRREAIKLGYVGGLTGRVADLGIAGRDGVILAVEQQNAAGGIHGRPIELIVKDDQQDPAVAVSVDQQLIDEGVVAIIGHMTSSMSVVGAPIANRHQVLMISPTTSTNDLTARKDHFFRVYPAGAQGAIYLAEHAADQMNINQVVVVYDTANKAHTYSYYQAFADAFENDDRQVTAVVTFESGTDASFTQLVDEIAAENPQCLLLLANAMDTAMICQQLAKRGLNIPIIANEWSATDQTLEFGGRSVEGMFFFHTFDRLSQNPKYLAFKKKFIDRFGYPPDFASCHAYDTAMVVFTALQQEPDPRKLPQTICDIGTFTGLQTEIHLDQYGDVKRKHFAFTIENHQFVKGEP